MIKYSDSFLKEAKKLSKKFKLIKSDLKTAVDEIEKKNDFGTPLGFNLYKKRVKNSSIPTGKSGGFRVVVYTKIEDEIVLLALYSKTQKESLTDEELRVLLKHYFENRQT